MNLGRYAEVRILVILGVITLAFHLAATLRSLLAMFADVFLIVILSYLLAFVLEPAVGRLAKNGLSRMAAAGAVYLVIAIASVTLVWVVLPTTVLQFGLLASAVPAILPTDQVWAGRVESFLAATVASSTQLASGLAAAAAGVLLVLFLSFYFLIERKEISKAILNLIPDQYEDDYLFLEKVLTETFASFLRVQVVLGLALGLITLLTLFVLRVEFALSTAIFSTVLAMIPVVGPVLMLIPVVLATVIISVQKTIIAVVVILLAAQLVYNLWAPKLLGDSLKIHPIVVFLSFIVGYKVAGAWGAIFAVPVAAAGAIIGQEVLKHWKEEADSK